MSRTGIKISLPGFDVHSATPEQCAVHSKYDTMKIKLTSDSRYFGRLDVTIAKNPVTPGAIYNLLTIDNDLGYLPAFFFRHSIKDSFGALSAETGNYFYLDVSGDRGFIASYINNQVKFDFVVSPTAIPANLTGDNISGRTYSFRYYVFANDGI